MIEKMRNNRSSKYPHPQTYLLRCSNRTHSFELGGDDNSKSESGPNFNINLSLQPGLNSQTPFTSAGSASASGFPSGQYFFIQAEGTKNVLTTFGFSTVEGSQVQLWPISENLEQMKAQV